jgi:hypothetical protein
MADGGMLACWCCRCWIVVYLLGDFGRRVCAQWGWLHRVTAVCWRALDDRIGVVGEREEMCSTLDVKSGLSGCSAYALGVRGLFRLFPAAEASYVSGSGLFRCAVQHAEREWRSSSVAEGNSPVGQAWG